MNRRQVGNNELHLDVVLYQAIDAMYQQNANQIRHLTSTNYVLNRLLDNLVRNRQNNIQMEGLGAGLGPEVSTGLGAGSGLVTRNFAYLFYPPTNANRNVNRNVNAVPILTPEEIQQYTTRSTFGTLEHPINEQCPIRLTPFSPEDVVLKINGCGHVFFENELMQWLQRNSRCPSCRYNLHVRSNNSVPAPTTHLFDLLEAFLDPNNPLFPAT
jgi:hypothetical protein